MPWYEQAFRRDYLLVYPHRNEAEARQEAGFALEVCRPTKGQPILDLCCGYGRHSKLIAEHGFPVVGCDLSADLLRLFGEKLDGLPERPQLVRGDARQLAFRSGVFTAVFSFFQSFGYFEEPREDFEVIEEVARILRPRGRFLLDLMNPDFTLANLDPVTTNSAAGMKMVQRRRYDAMEGKIIKNITVSMGVGTEKSWREEVRLYQPDQIAEFMEKAGLHVIGWFGGFEGSEFSRESPRMIVLAGK